MKILLLNYEYPPLGGGAGNATRYMAEYFADKGCEVTIITSHFKGLAKEEIINGVTIRRLEAGRKKMNQSNILQMLLYIIAAIAFGSGLVKKKAPDVALAVLGIPSGVVAWWFKKLYRLPYIVSIRGGDVPGTQPEQLRLYHAVCTPFIKLIWRNARYVVANSRGLRDLARTTMPDKEIVHIPNGVDIEKFKPASATSVHEETRLLYAGRLSPEKRVPMLIDSLASLREYKWHLTVVGEGPEEERIRERAGSHGLENRVTLTGWQDTDELISLYQSADVFVFPSTSEGMPNVVLEAMACGLPVVTTRIRGCEELVEHNENGILIEPDDATALTNALENLIEEPDTRRRFSEASTRRARMFSRDKVGKAYLELIRESGLSLKGADEGL